MRACDNCFAQKERCNYLEVEDTSCERCTRLSKPCTTNRPARRLGRRPLLPDLLKRPSNNTSRTSVAIGRGIKPCGFLATSLQPCEEYIVRQLSDPSQLAGFAIAPKIATEIHQQVMHTLLNHYDETHDGFISCYAAFASMKLVKIPVYIGDSIERGNSALRNFRQLKPPNDFQEFVPWIWLSLCCALHTRCALGWSASSIRRYVVGHIAQLGEKGAGMASHPIVVIMIIGHIYECLLHHERPLMSLPECKLEHMGAFVDTCAPLFRFLYELCLIRSDSKQQHHEDLKALEDLERSVHAWRPGFESPVVECLSEAGLSHLHTQVRTHTMAVLLSIHRTRHDYMSDDGVALAMASGIARDLEYAASMTGQAPSCVSLPFMLVALEVKDVHEQSKIRDSVSRYVAGTPFGIHDVLRAFLDDLWSGQLGMEGCSWTLTLQHLPSTCITI